MGLVGLFALMIWAGRVNEFSDTLKMYGNPEADTLFAFQKIMKSGGDVSLFLTVSSMILMAAFWIDFVRYMMFQNVPGYEKDFPDHDIWIMEELHDPPGDVFTLIGIAFTFAGLAASMASIPSDVIGQIMAPTENLDPSVARTSEDLGVSLMAAAIVFGSSLAVGLLASLQGVLLSILARRMAGRYSRTISSSSEFSKHIGSLPQIDSLLGRVLTVITDLSRVLSAAAAPPPPAAPRAKPSGGAAKARKPAPKAPTRPRKP